MKYVILLTEELANVEFSQILETSENTLRYSLDNNQFLVKFEGETPAFLSGKLQYNYEEILEILNSSQWAEQE
ncbi:MAG: hypothetical protein Unbinned579contig1003_40 [Prokaryotic dsDNA virus sp.]|nr:MAG: hypothetical protein Unbinned579contig1003_40 [Prokaryotic dsDNA virus sp.]|tara:strand:+ start:7811 stop:8029 length:219 start_codon:yes stop_codon:yes gene_type:complete